MNPTPTGSPTVMSEKNGARVRVHPARLHSGLRPIARNAPATIIPVLIIEGGSEIRHSVKRATGTHGDE